jgi:hypothetical protein
MNEEKKENSPPGEDYKIRCPKLGHQIQFSYCRFEQVNFPCSKILDCWYEHFNVEDHLTEVLTPEAKEKLFNPIQKPKLLSLVELIEQAKKTV